MIHVRERNYADRVRRWCERYGYPLPDRRVYR